MKNFLRRPAPLSCKFSPATVRMSGRVTPPTFFPNEWVEANNKTRLIHCIFTANSFPPRGDASLKDATKPGIASKCTTFIPNAVTRSERITTQSGLPVSRGKEGAEKNGSGIERNRIRKGSTIHRCWLPVSRTRKKPVRQLITEPARGQNEKEKESHMLPFPVLLSMRETFPYERIFQQMKKNGKKFTVF